MLPDYGRQYRALYERHWWWRARERWIVRALECHRPAHGWGAALDVGCGDGLFFDRLAALGCTVDGVENDAALVDPEGPHRARITVGPFDERFQPGTRYSLVLMLDVLEHLRDPLGALRHAVSLLEPGGVFLATVPAFLALWTTHDVLNQHVTRYTRRRLLAL
ncbi:MAG TPA: class I SAM-dependent methyltransferase, partial [Gemmatimonadaceae bacterium]